MMRLLLLCLLLPAAATALSDDTEGSAILDGQDDEDLFETKVSSDVLLREGPRSVADKAVGETKDQLILIIIIAAVAVVALSIAAIVAAIIIRRRANTRRQGIYSVPAEQDQKGAV